MITIYACFRLSSQIAQVSVLLRIDEGSTFTQNFKIPFKACIPKIGLPYKYVVLAALCYRFVRPSVRR